jgi:hypothetical protein
MNNRNFRVEMTSSMHERRVQVHERIYFHVHTCYEPIVDVETSIVLWLEHCTPI